MNNKRKYMIAIILLLAIGFAAITSTLYLKGNVSIASVDDFDVYFSRAKENGVQNNSIITDPKTITFSSELQGIGDEYTLEYNVTNGSKNFDAKITVNCVSSSEYLKVENTFDSSNVLQATDTRTGTLNVTLIKSYASANNADLSTEISIKCTISADAVERSSKATGTPADKVVLIPVTAVNSEGTDLNATSYEITGTTKDTLLEKLVESGKVENSADVDALIEVESDDFDDLATTTFDVSKIADNGDTVVILHYNETTSEWEYITEATVTNGKVTIDLSSYSPVAFAVKKSDGTYEVIKGTNLYNLMKANVSNETIDFSVNSGTSGTNGIYITTETDSGKAVYYYRGSYTALNNNLIFNNMCWKIIRTTETGGVKLIYNGTPTDGQCTTQTGTGTQVGTSVFNTNYNDNAYVGYMYGTAGSTTYEATHANINDSTIKTYIDNWYTTNFDADATAKLEDTVFCNDRSIKAYDAATIGSTDYSSYGVLGYGTSTTLYGAAHRAWYYTKTPSPSLKCTNANDKFTVSPSNGNGKLTNPVGLITLDEVILAGFNTYASNTSNYQDTTNYLYTNSVYWTLSPVNGGTNGRARVGYVSNTGYVGDSADVNTDGVRPVISLKSGTTVTTDGDGSTTNPYVVE